MYRRLFPARRPRGERGAALVESALVMPVFALIIFSTLEFGLMFRSYLTLTNTSREAARFVSILGNDPDADFQVVNGIVASFSGQRGSTLERVVIYKSTGPSQTTASGSLAACRTASVANLCNSYTGAALTTAIGGWSCQSTSPDRFWCPTTRKVLLSDPPDYVGIYVQIRHQGLTGAVGLTKTLSEDIVMRIEPRRS